MKKDQQQLNEAGFASMVIALTIIIILGLISVAFTQFTRHEQQQALNKQLASQAYYAAESAINDEVKTIKGNVTAGTAVAAKNSCTTPNNVLDASYSVAYTCLLVDPAPTSIDYQLGAETDKSAVFSTSAVPSPLTIHWNTTGNTTFNSSLPTNAFYPSGTTAGKWVYPALLRFTITPLADAGFDRTSLIGNAMTIFLYPSTVNTNHTVAYGGSGSASEGLIASGQCDATAPSGDPIYPCSVKITGLPSNASFSIHVLSLYKDSTVHIDGLNGATAIKFTGAQVLVDATGKAQDVLKRIQVRVPINPNALIPDNYVIEGQQLCKRFWTDASGNTSFFDLSGSAVGAGACYLQ